jgi:hypothetical protein
MVVRLNDILIETNPDIPGAFVDTKVTLKSFAVDLNRYTISWYENGIKVGAPKKIVAVDPWSVELHTGPTLPQRRTWVEPQLTDHLFFFQPNSTENLVVEVKDRFGNKYTKRI